MSAFVVEDKIINSVVSFLAISRDEDHIRRLILDETGADLRTTEGEAQLGAAMFALNCNAVEQRYGVGEAAHFRDLDYKFQTVVFVRKIQAYKSLQCWLYQCSEGDVPDTSLLFSTMQKVKSALAESIINGLNEYQDAKW